MPTAGKRIRTGVALSLAELCAADVRLGDGTAAWRVPLDPPDPNGTAWPSLTTALRQLADRLGAAEGKLVVALMPPLTEVRRLDLPPLKREQVLQLLSRNASRYFVTAREPQVVGTSIPRRGSRSGPVPVLGVAASARLVSAIAASAKEAGWILEGVVPAEVGWSSAAAALWPTLGKGVAHVLVHHEDRTDLLRMEGGALAGVRRFRTGSLDAQLIAEALHDSRSNGTTPRVGALGAAGPRQELIRALPRESAIVSTPAAEWTNASGDPMVAAATFVTPDEGLTLRTGDVAELRARHGRRLTFSLFGASVALLLGASLLELWGVKRELAAVQAERARIKPQLQTTLAGLSTFEASNRKLAALFAAQRETPYLSGVIASVTDALPESAYLLSFRARRDTLILDGLATSSAEAFAGLESVPELANVKSVGGVQRQLQDDGTALEHFTVQARMLLPVPLGASPFQRRQP
ncbi:MAG TPA: PilN domain-containing protein [Gemmatimonadaceae bacterium]|nr:PilN domain-containing protein [Gemmatimonadaceae bacterium]